MRLQSSGGYDNNVREVLEERLREGGTFLRMLGDAHGGRTRLPLGIDARLDLRFLTERYLDQPEEARAQGEVRLGLDLGGPGKVRTRIDLGLAARDYPDSTERDFGRRWARLAWSAPLGPHGTLLGRLEFWGLDFRRTPRPDQQGTSFDLSYEHPLLRLATGEIGLELGRVHHGLASIQIESDAAGENPVFRMDSPDRRDRLRLLHVGFRVVRGGVYRLEYARRWQSSNSIDAGFSRHELRWLVAHSLPLGLNGQFYGNLEHTTYTDRRIDEILVLRSGEVEAGEDDNTIALRLARPVSAHWTIAARHAWYRNESLLIQNYYRKRVWSAGLTWEAGSASGF